MSQPGIKIRPTDPERDLDDLMALFSQVDLYHAQRVPYVFRETQTNVLDFVQRISYVPDHYLLGAEVGGRVVGMVYFFARESPSHPMFVPRRYIMVDNLAVLDAHRRQGVGRALMRAVEAIARDLDISNVRLNVWEANTEAIRFYDTLGYETLARYMIKRTDERNNDPCQS